MDPSDTFQLDENLARLLAAYDQSIDGGDSDAPTLGITGASAAKPSASPLSGSGPHRGSGGEVLPDHEQTPSPWVVQTPAPGTSHRVGRFVLRRQLGKGGCGIVFLAYDPKLEREVALKIPRPEMLLSEDARRRLIREALAAAEFDHPNLVAVYETGEIGPICYIATAFCPGATLGEWLDRQAFPVPVRQAARLVATVAEAVQHAHDRGVLHRDLKPNNIILQSVREDANQQEPPVGSCPLRGEHFIPRVVDFGLAKLLERGGPSETTTRQVLGTPKYMAPEQALARHDDIGPTADVYALGVILYELLAGRAPYEGSSDVDVLRQAVEGNLTPPRHYRPELPRDLEAICLKAMARVPDNRYRTAIDFADDLRRYLDGKPTLARPLKWSGRAGRWLRRNDQVVALAIVTVIATVLLAGLMMSTYQSRQLKTDRDTALREQAERNKSGQYQEYARAVRAVFLAWRAGDSKAARELLSEAQKVAKAGNDPPDFALGYLANLIGSERKAIVCPAGPIASLAISPDGALLATGHHDGSISVWKRATGEHLTTTSAHDWPVLDLSFTNASELISAESPRVARLWSITRDGVLTPGSFRPDNVKVHPSGLATARHGGTIYTGGDDGVVRAWDQGDELLFATESVSGPAPAVGVNPDGSGFTVATAGPVLLPFQKNRRQKDISSDTGTPSLLRHTKDGPLLAISVVERTAVVSVVSPAGQPSLRKSYRLPTPAGGLTAIDLSLDGTHLAVAGEQGTVSVYPLDQTKPAATITQGPRAIRKIALSEDGRFLAVLGQDEIKIWSVGEPTSRLTLPGDDLTQFRFLPASDQLVTAGRGGVIRVWNMYTGRQDHTLYGHIGQVTALAGSPDGRTLVSGGVTGDVKAWDLRSGLELFSIRRHEGPVTVIEFSAGGKLLVTAGNQIAVWQAAAE
jgi:WD40 repeat protein